MDSLISRKSIFTKFIFALMLLVFISGATGWMVNAEDGGGDGFYVLSKTQISSSRFDEQERLRVIVQLNVPGQTTQAELMTPTIHTTQNELMSAMKAFNVRLIHEYDYIPFMAMEVDRAAFEGLLKSALVVGIEEDKINIPFLNESTVKIKAPEVWSLGYTGIDQVVAVLDTGVDKTHNSLLNKVVSEACYSSSSLTSTSLCPGGESQSTAVGSGIPCTYSGCDHGTHVAGIVAANGDTVDGVAKDAKLISIQVFHLTSDNIINAFDSDIAFGMERIYELNTSFNISSVNLSLGSLNIFSDTCDQNNSLLKASVDKLRSVGIVTIAASGNGYSTTGISSPACISTVVSVGATDDFDNVASFSNSAEILDLLAPGSFIFSTIPVNTYINKSGTSMAAPHVAGAWVLIRSAIPNASNDAILNAFKTTGLLITDYRNAIQKPRIDVLAALQSLLTPHPTVPENITASDGDYLDKIRISWSESENTTYYQVYRNTSNGSTSAIQIVNNHLSSPYEDISAIPGIIYYFWVKACNEFFCSDFSLTDSGYSAADGLTAPTAVSATDGIYNDKVSITWNGVGGASFYKVFRNTVNSPVGAITLTESDLNSPFDDMSALHDTEYFYWVNACKNSGCSEYSLSDMGYLLDDFYLFLPIINKNSNSFIDPILNGDFEDGQDGSWTENSSNDFELIVNKDYPDAPLPHNGYWEAWLGGKDFEISRLSQIVTISPSAPYLHFWYWIGSADTFCGDDFFKLKINNGEVLKLDLCTSTNTSGWVERVVNLSAYAGTAVTLMFEVTNDFYLNSNFFLDDVSMTSSSTITSVNLQTFEENSNFTQTKNY